MLSWPLISLFSLRCHSIGDSNLNFESQFRKGSQPMRNNSIFQTGTCWKDPTWTEIDFGKICEIFLLGSLVFLCNHQPCFQDSFFEIFGKKGRNIWGAMSSSDRINWSVVIEIKIIIPKFLPPASTFTSFSYKTIHSISLSDQQAGSETASLWLLDINQVSFIAIGLYQVVMSPSFYCVTTLLTVFPNYPESSRFLELFQKSLLK